MQHLPAYFYKSTILSLDDDTFFSSSIAALLGREFIVKTFETPENLLNYVFSYEAPLSNNLMIRDCSEHDDYDTANHALVDLDIPALYQHKTNPEKCSEISVIITDFNMPVMDGIEVCKKLTNCKAKKILLTGAADLQIAIDAFNHNIIDRYIRKDSPSIAEDIKKHAQELALQYYIEQTKPLLNHLEAQRPSPLSDSLFVNFFQNWCRENQIIDYTLIDKNGSFSLTNKQTEELYFIVHTNTSLDTFIQLNDDDNTASPFLAPIKARQKIPFFGVGVDSWQVETSNWETHCHAANVFTGRENYYWAVANKQN